MTLKDWLAKENLTVTEFARRMGRPQPTVARYVSGDRMPEKEAMREIAELTGKQVTPNDFYEVNLAPEVENAPASSEAQP